MSTVRLVTLSAGREVWCSGNCAGNRSHLVAERWQKQHSTVKVLL
ncbi:hypothetical protein LEMLEM_LOCUS22746 [Lemmus lemmus]